MTPEILEKRLRISQQGAVINLSPRQQRLAELSIKFVYEGRRSAGQALLAMAKRCPKRYNKARFFQLLILHAEKTFAASHTKGTQSSLARNWSGMKGQFLNALELGRNPRHYATPTAFITIRPRGKDKVMPFARGRVAVDLEQTVTNWHKALNRLNNGEPTFQGLSEGIQSMRSAYAKVEKR